MKNRIFSTFASMLLGIGIAGADELELPTMKEGLWEAHTQQTIQGKTFETSLKMCKSHELDKSMRETAKSARENLRKMKQCGDAVVTRPSANVITSESHCAKDSSVIKSTITFQGDTSYHMEMNVTTPQSQTVTIIDDRFVGSCPADMKPGDAVMGDGKKMNLGAH